MKGKYIISGVEGMKDNTIIACSIDKKTIKKAYKKNQRKDKCE